VHFTPRANVDLGTPQAVHNRVHTETRCRFNEQSEGYKKKVEAAEVGFVPPFHVIVGDQALDDAIAICYERSHGVLLQKEFEVGSVVQSVSRLWSPGGGCEGGPWTASKTTGERQALISFREHARKHRDVASMGT
jgi:hypothetical protein